MKKRFLVTKFYSLKKTKGFTLIELIVAMGISLIILGVIVLILSLSGNILNSTISRNNLNDSGRYAMDYVEKEIRRSLNIYSIDEFNIDAKNNNLGFLLEIVPYNSSENKYQYIYYYLDQRTLTRYSISSSQPIEEGLKDKKIGANGIAGKIKNISKSYYNRDEKFVHLNIECEEDNLVKVYETSIYAGVGI